MCEYIGLLQGKQATDDEMERLLDALMAMPDDKERKQRLKRVRIDTRTPTYRCINHHQNIVMLLQFKKMYPNIWQRSVYAQQQEENEENVGGVLNRFKRTLKFSAANK